jgi:hypothetical protein
LVTMDVSEIAGGRQKKWPLHWENNGKVHRSIGNPIYWAKPTVNVQRNWSAANHWEPGPSLATMWGPRPR